MKKISIIILGIFLLIFAPTHVNAVSASVKVNCSNVQVGKTATCTLSGTATGGTLTGIEAQISISGGATIESVAKGPVWDPIENSTTSILYASGATEFTSGTIATFTIKGNTAGSVTFKVNNIKVVDTDGMTSSIGNTQTTFTVQAPATQPPVTPPPATNPTAKPTTKATSKTQTTSVTTNFQEPTTQAQVGAELVLSSVTVNDFEVTYQDGKYFATVNYDTESVEVNATADERITIIGQGTRNLAVGKNVVELVIKNELNEATTIQVIITRPEDTNFYDTTLSSLRVVGYKLDFNKDKKEYTLTVDSSVKEIYVIAESNNTDVAITGAGLKTLVKGKNDIHILSQYGNKFSTEYIIHVKRSNNSLIMFVVIGTLGTGLIGSVAYFLTDRKKLINNTKQEKNKILAEANRAVVNTQDNPTINGESTIGVGRAPVKPIASVADINSLPTLAISKDVSEATKQENEHTTIDIVKPTMVTPKPVVVPQPAAIKEGVTQVVETKAPSNPVAVAQSTVVPKPTIQKDTNNLPKQVKVVKKSINPQTIKTINPVNTSNNYNNDQIVINTGK